MLDRVVLRRVRGVMRHPNLQAELLHELFEVGFEQIRACTIAPTPIAQEQERLSIGIEGLPVSLPPLAETITREFTGIMARPQGHVAVIPLQIIQAMGNDDPLSEAGKVMIPGFYRGLRIQRPRTIKIANQLFFFVSMLRTGWPRLM